MKTMDDVVTRTFMVENFRVDIQIWDDRYEAWLYEKSIGIKEHLFGISKDKINYTDFVNLVEGNLENQSFIDDYVEKYMND